MFDGFEMGIFPLVARPALIDVLGIASESVVDIDVAVGRWNGRIVAAFLIGAAIGGWVFGWLGDRIGRVRAMIFSVLTYSLFTGLCGFAQSGSQLALLRFAAALGMGGEWALGVALVMESWPAQFRPLLAGLIGAASNVGFLLASYVVPAWELLGTPIKAGGWRMVLGLCAFPALLTIFLRMFVPESEQWRLSIRSEPRARIVDVFAPELRGRTVIGALLGGIALIGTWGSVQWIPLWVNQLTHSQDMANLAGRCSAIGAIIGAMLGALIGARAGRRWAYFFLCLGSLVVCAYLFRWHLGRRSTIDWSFYLAVVFTGALTASFYGWLPLYLPELFPTRLRATGQGFSFNFGRIIAAGGALSMGYLMSDQVFRGD
jgi:MFS family permease